MSESTQTEAVHPLDEGAAGADENLRELRGLIVGPEMEQIAAIRNRLDDPEARAAEISSSLADAINIRSRKDGKLQRALNPLLEESLRASVKRDPKVIADALYPAIGDAVRKAVGHALQELFDSLNLMLNRGFSLESWKWRMEAWRTGKSFGQVAITRTLTYRVEQVFLVHRKTGLLIGQASFDDGVVQDADLISGMLTAVQDFVRDSFARKKDDDLQFMEIGGFKIWLVHGPLALLAPVVSGQPPPELREVFERELEAIHEKFHAALDNFEGDTAELTGAEMNLRRCLLGQQKPVKRKSSGAVWIVFALVLLAIASLIGLRVRDNRRWTQYLDRLHNEPGIIVVDAQRHWFGYAVSGLRDPLAVYPPTLLDAYRVPAKEVSERWEPYLSLDPAFAVSRQLETEKAVVERQVIRFDLNSAQLPMSQFDGLDTAAESIVKLRQMAAENGQRVAIKIDGHTDQTGAEDRNKQLSEARAQTVATLLLRRGVTPDMLDAEGLGDSRPEHAGDATYPVELNRRVTFKVFLIPAVAGAAK